MLSHEGLGWICNVHGCLYSGMVHRHPMFQQSTYRRWGGRQPGSFGFDQEAPGSKRDSSPEFGARGNERFRECAPNAVHCLLVGEYLVFLTSSDEMLYHVGLILTKLALPEALYPEANPRYEQ
uniref:Uncharacterized protein n=1 Tax=Candidatus Kentrum sp. UNK TaxID=2126344 RepID=A0A451AXP0_9GAMM|nr:MAG: hypothetical protein BECKUNK1418G_GA0071005_103126 [Candidatus Kentron sp. UNK]VFK70793.1 MAG: hypothetical protein BECKUNK1418H_GA0071006_103826 [Candidatus Kentron sp. UNK]